MGAAGAYDVFVADLAGSGVVRLTATRAHTSRRPGRPDGRTIAFRSFRGSPRRRWHVLWTVQPDGTGLRQVRIEGCEGPAWSPDGGLIACPRGDRIVFVTPDAREDGSLALRRSDPNLAAWTR